MQVAEPSLQERAVKMFMLGNTPKQVSDSLSIPEGTAKSWKDRHFKPSEVISKLESEIQEAKLQITAHETEIKGLKLKVTESDSEIQQSKLKTSKDETEIQQMKLKITANETEIQQLKLKVSADETTISKLKAEITAHETEIQGLKLNETAMINEAKLLRGQIDYLEKLSQSTSQSGDKLLDVNQRHLNDRINDLKAQLVIADQKLEKAGSDEKERAEKAKKEADNALSIANKNLFDAVQAHNKQIETERAQAKKTLETSIKTVEDNAKKEVDKYKAYAKKWEDVELQNKREIFLRNLKFAFVIVCCLVFVQGVEASLFTQLAYSDAGFTGTWVKIVGGALAIGFQGIGLFLTVNRGKKSRAVIIGKDKDKQPIFKKNAQNEIVYEQYYEMTTMQILCFVDFLLNCFVIFQKTNIWTANPEVIGRLFCFSTLAPLGIYFTSEILLYLLDKREALNN